MLRRFRRRVYDQIFLASEDVMTLEVFSRAAQTHAQQVREFLEANEAAVVGGLTGLIVGQVISRGLAVVGLTFVTGGLSLPLVMCVAGVIKGLAADAERNRVIAQRRRLSEQEAVLVRLKAELEQSLRGEDRRRLRAIPVANVN
jgi:hypothetical protein